MKRMHWYYKFLIVFLVFFSMFFLFNKNISNLVNGSSYKGYINSIILPINTVSRGIIFNYKETVRENNRLKQNALKNNTIFQENGSLKKEIEELKKTMEIERIYTGYDITYARTIIRNKMYWYNTITIDKGSNDGIKKNQAVVGLDGLIGIVSNTTKRSSSVKLITNNDTNHKISGMVKTNKDTAVGLIEGYEYPYIKVSLATSSKNVKIGDKFYSYGLDNFPKNIYIGEVKKIQSDNYDLGSVLYVQPKQDMNDINYVVVLGN